MSSRPASSPSLPLTLGGISGSAGVAVGQALVLGPRKITYVQRLIAPSEIDAELSRFDDAVRLAQDDLRALAHGNPEGFARAELSIMEAYMLMLGDETLRAAVQRHVRDELHCVEWAVSSAISGFCTTLGASPDPYLRERCHDFEFVGERLLMALTGSTTQRNLPRLEGRSVVVAHDLSPADLLALGADHVIAIATEIGTRTSHTSIVARALEIPAVVGVAGLLDHVVSGDRIVVDGLQGHVTVSPSDEMVSAGLSRGQRHVELARTLLGGARRRAHLGSGEPVSLLANIEFAHEARYAAEHGAEGIGLYRTEFLYIDRRELPTEDEQLEAYRAVVQAMNGAPVVFRTFDLGGDKPLASLSMPREPNPALGLRATRLALEHPDLLLTQLRAMIRASAAGDVRIMVPMISTMREWRAVQRLFNLALAQVDEASHPRSPAVSLGMMIEVPAAAVLADVFVRHAAFVSLGTNDLVQHTLAVDRTSPHLSRLASPFDPAVLRLIRGVVLAARSAHTPVSVCGAMAGDPLAAILLVGLGCPSLSVEPVVIPEVKEALSRVTLREITRVAEESLSLETAEDVEQLLALEFAARLFDLLSGDVSNAPTSTS